MRKTEISFLLEAGELQLLQEVVFLEPYLMDGVQGARKTKKGFRVKFQLEDLEDALEALSFWAGCHSSEKKRQDIAMLLDKLGAHLVLIRKFRFAR